MEKGNLDPKVLGQLLLMQNYISNLPDKNSIVSFVTKGLRDVPGVSEVIFVESIEYLPPHQKSWLNIPIRIEQSYFGELLIQVRDKALFSPYQDYIRNFIFMIGIILEEKHKRDFIKEQNELLEDKIFERTKELETEKENFIESQRQFRELLSNIRLLAVILDKKGNITFINKYLLDLTGYSLEEVIGKNWFEIFLPFNIIGKVKEIFTAYMNGEEYYPYFENEIFTKDKRSRLISWNNTLLRNGARNIIGAASIGEDITERRQAEIQLKEKTDEIEAQNEEYQQLNEELLQITEELQKANEKTEDSERLFKSYFHLNPAATFVFVFQENDFTLIEINETTLQLTEGNAARYIGAKVSEIYAGFPYMIEHFYRCYNEKISFEIIDHYKVLYSETYEWMKFKFSFLEPNKLLLFAENITKQKNHENQLRLAKEEAERSEEKYNNFIQHAFEGIYLTEFDEPIDISLPVDRQIDEIYRKAYMGECNLALARMYGISDRKDLIGKRLIDFHGGSDNPLNRSTFRKFIEAGYKSIDDETEEIASGGNTIIFSTNAIGIINNGFLQRIWGTTIDITEKKRVEKELNEAKKRAEESEERFRIIALNTPDHIIVHDLELRYVLVVNPQLGLTSEDMIGKTDFEILSASEAEQLVRVKKRILESKQPEYFETSLLSKSGTSEFFEGVYVPMQNKKEEVVGLLGYFRNVTEKRRMIEELRSAKEKAEESNQLKTAFLQNMSHEIRTPMNAIMGFAELMTRNLDNKQKISKFSDIIVQRCKDLLEIISDILDISKIESGQNDVINEEFDIEELFEELTVFLSTYTIKLEKQHVQLQLEAQVNPEDKKITTDKLKLKQIFINLITNALKFTDEGSIRGGCRYNGTHQIEFFVKDTGIGIPDDKHDFVFERFTQINQDPKRIYSGTGLGLPIVKGLVKILGGDIHLESEPGKGSHFFFSIPLARSKNTPLPPEKSEESPREIISNHTLLVVEDDYFNMEYLKEVFSDTKLNMFFSETGKDAIEKSLQHPIDLILMDIRLPDMSGYDAAKIILKEKPSMKIIAQTAYASQNEKQIAFQSGFVDYLSKPSNSQLILRCVAKHLHTKH